METRLPTRIKKSSRKQNFEKKIHLIKHRQMLAVNCFSSLKLTFMQFTNFF